MVARYSNKRAKYTYAERVLGALSEIQKDHRKHAVHMATLRAHVRKTADARKDKMGPQWAQWVSRTVNRLVDDGILDTTDAHGNIAFTPNAKKTITKVRRESMGPGVVCSPGLEHKIWKDVTRRFSGAGVKRARRRSSAVPEHALENGSWDDEDVRPRKRQARKSMSHKTKAELEIELQDALERLHDVQELEPINAEELSVLQEELSNREKEVAVLREELARLKDQPPTDDRRVTVGTPTSMVTPPPTNPSLPSSSGRTATSTRSRLAMHGVTRTLSGSLISNISKQPTPEPSDVGSQRSEDDIDELVFDDSMEDASMSAFPEFEHFPVPQQALGLATPQSSPLLADQEDFEPEEVIDRYEEGGVEPAEELTFLKGELESQSATLDALREEHKRVLSERDELRASVASRDDRIQALQVDVRTRDEALASEASQRAGLEKTLAGELAQRKELESAIKASETALSIERERNSILQTNASGLQAKCDSLQGEVHHLGVHSGALAEELNAARMDASKWRAAHHESEKKLKKATDELSSLQDRLGSAQAESHSLTKALDTSTTLLGERTAELEHTQATLSSTQSELGKTRLALEAASASQATLSSRIAELERTLEDARAETRALHIENTALERTSGNLQDTVAQLRGELSHAKDQLDSTRAEVQQAQDVIDALRVSHAAAQVDAAASKNSVSALEGTVDTLCSQLQDAAAAAAELHESLETEQTARRAAESNAVSTQARCDKLLSDLADKTARLSSTTKTLAKVKRTEDETRRQLGALEEKHASELAARAAERSGFEEALEIAHTKEANLETQVDRLNGRLSAVSEELASALTEKEELSIELREAKEHAATLQEDLELAQDDNRNAEQEIDELRTAKAEDEASIQSLKAGLAKLRQLQMDALNEVDSKMISAHTAPTPGSRRRSSIAPRLRAGTQV
ncbi:hypothetical protein TRAPUB_8092 [Trametes pubescens]|uniref:Uncharacterized protein n=1 Tax=Trametes pubescens TaxID=154538 RepID=A0A1M2W673_TRAPU|nr:hypothetical protein TRAPUB_8092 [Trametes pubescens]